MDTTTFVLSFAIIGSVLAASLVAAVVFTFGPAANDATQHGFDWRGETPDTEPIAVPTPTLGAYLG